MTKRRHLYFTFGESYGGIYKSQVVDVVRYMNSGLGADIALLAILPMKLWSRQRTIIHKDFFNAAVWSALPFQGRFFMWRWHTVLLGMYVLMSGRKHLICRGAFATQMALDLRRLGLVKSVVYDGRGAMAAENDEYSIYPTQISSQVPRLERAAVLNADHRIAVTDALADYWSDRFGFRGAYSRIPCTLASSWNREAEKWEEARAETREKMGIGDDDLLLLYSGSSAGWQSFDLLIGELDRALASSPRIQVLLLCPETPQIEQFLSRWQGRTRRMFVQPSEVLDWICSADIGLVLREKSVTNSVAMPTKFAEYLSAGLHLVVTKPCPAADYVVSNGLGYVWEKDFDWRALYKAHAEGDRGASSSQLIRRKKARLCAYRDFLKSSDGNRKGYREVLGDFRYLCVNL